MPASRLMALTAEPSRLWRGVRARPRERPRRPGRDAAERPAGCQAQPVSWPARGSAPAACASRRWSATPTRARASCPSATRPVLIAVALPGRDGQPDLTTLRAFRGRGAGLQLPGRHLAPAGRQPRRTRARASASCTRTARPEDCVWAEVGAHDASTGLSGSVLGALDVGAVFGLDRRRGCRAAMCGGTMVRTPFDSLAGL